MHYLHLEDLWQVLLKAWNKYLRKKMSRVFVHHTQVAGAIYKCKDGNKFVKEREWLSFDGVRHVLQPYFGNEYISGYTLSLT